jgi:hypothetical protein
MSLLNYLLKNLKFERLFSKKCFKCKGNFDKNDFVMRANNQIYHVDCFRCCMCNKQLSPGEEFALREDGILCKEDHITYESKQQQQQPTVLLTNTCQNITNLQHNNSNTNSNNNNNNILKNSIHKTADETFMNHHDFEDNQNCISPNYSSPSSTGLHNTHNLISLNNSTLSLPGTTNQIHNQPLLTSSTVHNNSNSSNGHVISSHSQLHHHHSRNSSSLNSSSTSSTSSSSSSSTGLGIGMSSSGGGSSGGHGHGHGHGRKDKTTRVRTVLNEKQLHTLRTCYGANPRPDALMKEQLVEMTGLSPRVIRVWFQNKRCKDKKKTILIKQMQEQQKVRIYFKVFF